MKCESNNFIFISCLYAMWICYLKGQTQTEVE